MNHTTTHRAASGTGPSDHVAEELYRYDKHLRDVKGLAVGTRLEVGAPDVVGRQHLGHGLAWMPDYPATALLRHQTMPAQNLAYGRTAWQGPLRMLLLDDGLFSGSGCSLARRPLPQLLLV